MLTDQAMVELTGSVAKLKAELDRAWGEVRRLESQNRARDLTETKAAEDAGGTEEDAQT